MDGDGLTITQGATRRIVVDEITDSDGETLDVTGWAVRAVIADGPDRPALAEWSDSPSGGQGEATADGSAVTLLVPADMSEGWSWDSATLQVLIDEPNGEQRTERIADERVHLSRSIIEPNGE